MMKLLPNSRVAVDEKLSFQNVVSKRNKFHYSELENYYKAFVTGIVDAGYSLKGPYFYSLNNVPKDEYVDIEMFFPIVEESFEVEGYQFSSYFEISPLIKTVITGDFDVQTERAYAELLATLEVNELDIATPFYHVYPRSGMEYVELYLGYYERLEEQEEL